jgi:hypothetical protein
VVEGLDAQLDEMLVTLDRDARREIVLDIQRRATEVGCLGFMLFYNYSARLLNWPYYRCLSSWSPKGQDLKNHWLDPDDPSFQGRPG